MSKSIKLKLPKTVTLATGQSSKRIRVLICPGCGNPLKVALDPDGKGSVACASCQQPVEFDTQEV